MERHDFRKMTKKLQRKVNKIIRKVNKNLEQDELWRGRFVMRQKERYVFVFEDGSGIKMNIKFTIYDKRKKIMNDVVLSCLQSLTFFPAHVFDAVNNFILYDAEVWDKEEEAIVRADKTNYTKIPLNPAEYTKIGRRNSVY